MDIEKSTASNSAISKKKKRKERTIRNAILEKMIDDDGMLRTQILQSNTQSHADAMSNVSGVARHGKLVYGSYVWITALKHSCITR